MDLKMRHVLIIYVLLLMLSLIQAEQKAEVQKSEVTKLEALNFGEVEVESDSEQSDVQRKRDSGYIYNRPNRVSSNARFRFQAHQSKSQIASKIPAQLSRPFMKYGPPNHSTSGPNIRGHHAHQHSSNKLQYHVNQQQSNGFADGLVEQEVPSPIRNVDFTVENPIASQNNEPFGMHTANYLPPENQKLPAYTASTDNFIPQSPQSFLDHGQIHGTNSQSQNFVQAQDQQISDAALFLSENAQAIQQLYGAPASNQDFTPGHEQFHDTGNQIHRPNGQFKNFESTSQNPQEFRVSLPSYASGTLESHETLEQVQSLEKDRLIIQLRQALAQAQTTPSTDVVGRYAQNQASFIQNQELLATIGQQIKSHISTTPQTITFGPGNTAFSQSGFISGTTADPLKFSFNYGAPSTTQTPITTTTTTVTGVLATQPPQSSKGDGTIQVTSTQPALNQPVSPTTGSPVGIYGGFVPTFITGSNFVPSYSTNVFTSGSVRPVQPPGAPTHFGIPIPTEPPRRPASGSAPSIPAMTAPSPTSPLGQPGVALTPAAIPVQSIRPVVTPLHPLATPVHPIAAPLHPVLSANPTQVQTMPAVTSGVQHTYGVQTALINPILYKPVKAVYPVYYYPNLAYQQPVLPSHPWNYAPSYAQTKPAQIWK